MKNKLKLFFKKFVLCLTSVVCFIPSFQTDVFADTAFYSYPFYGSGLDGQILYGANVNFSPINSIIINSNYGNERHYQVGFFVSFIATGNSGPDALNNAILGANNKLGSNSTTEDKSLLQGIRYSGSPGNWTYESPVNCTRVYYYNHVGGTWKCCYIYVFYIYPSSSIIFSCYSKAGVPVLTTTLQDWSLLAYAQYLVDGVLPSGYGLQSWAGGWVKDSNAIAPVYNMNNLNNNGVVADDYPVDDGTSGDTPSNPGSGYGVMEQTQYIENGAVQLNVGEGAFQQQQQQQQTIEENAVNVTVNNNNALTQENYQELNSLINNYNGSSDDQNDPFQQAIANFQAFHAITLAFAGLASVVFGWLPWWVTALLGAMFSMVCVFIVLRLIHLFK